ncbi:uncharacterized protein LOC124553289 [Schistocerca americana]|uniref:uncharacterized protein LOC124553289 n=1 Tax=Schistocerca americana TaxID=7009 RepID=UPI001F4FFB54|nr:uncharacterized protein LOC124553289 [Schistocerca americana]
MSDPAKKIKRLALQGLAEDNKGTREINSSMIIELQARYVEELSRNLPGVDVVFYPNNCGGQQKDKYMIATYLCAAQRLDSGHTQNEGDGVHSITERAVKSAKKSETIYVSHQYISVIRNAKENGSTLHLREMGFSEFNDMKAEQVQEGKEAAAVDLGALLDAGGSAVVTLVTGDTRLAAHRAVLAARSPVFAAVFSHGTLEATVPDVGGQLLRHLVAYMYTLQAPQLARMSPQLLVAADKYGLSGLKAQCEQQLAAQLSVETAVATAVLAIRNS